MKTFGSFPSSVNKLAQLKRLLYLAVWLSVQVDDDGAHSEGCL